MADRDSRRRLWTHADFMKLWTAETISQLGSQVTLLAVPLVALTALHASAFQVGLLGTAEYAPFLLVGLPAGVWVDRLRRRPILITGDLSRAAILGSIPLAYALGLLTLTQLYLVAFTTGVFTVFFDVAYQSYLPVLVAPDQLVDGNAKLEVSRSGAQLGGPALAGLLIQALGAPVAILADALSFLGSGLFIALIRRAEPRPERPAGPHRGALRREMAEGLRYVLHHRLLRAIAATTATSNLFSQILFVALLVYMVRRLHLPSGTIGLTFTLGNAGFLVGALLSGRLAAWLGVGRAIIFGIACSVGGLLVPLAPPSLAVPFIVAGCFLPILGEVVYNVNQVSLRQAITPAAFLGRMNATMRFMVWGTIPLGSLLGGALAAAIGLRATLWVGAVGGTLAILPVALSPIRALRRIQDVPSRRPAATATPADAPPDPP